VRPIGVFDSGVGGLSVLRELRRQLPAEDLIYVADSGNAPYGERPDDFVRARSMAIVEFLRLQGAKAVVVACNTATSVAIDALRARFQMPIVGMEPAVKPAAAATTSRVIGVLGTTKTLASEKFSRLITAQTDGVTVLTQPCPDLVTQVERGELATPATAALVEQYVGPMLERGADTIVLGCTHFAFLSETLQEIVGPRVRLVDPADAVARQARRRLQEADSLAIDDRRGTDQFWTTGEPAAVQTIITHLWKQPVTVQRVPDRDR